MEELYVLLGIMSITFIAFRVAGTGYYAYIKKSQQYLGPFGSDGEARQHAAKFNYFSNEYEVDFYTLNPERWRNKAGKEKTN